MKLVFWWLMAWLAWPLYKIGWRPFRKLYGTITGRYVIALMRHDGVAIPEATVIKGSPPCSSQE